MRTYVVANNKPSEQESKRTILSAHLLPRLGALRIDAIGKRDVEAMKADLLARGLKPKTVNNIVGVLSRVLRYAMEIDLLESVPRFKKVRVPPQPFDFLETAELTSVLAASSPEQEWTTAILLAADAGLRRGELRALRQSDVDFRAECVTVSRSLWRHEMTSPKSHRSRTVPLTRRLLRALKASRHLRGPLVLCDLDGRPLGIEALRWNLPRLARKAGIRRITWHVLRHTFCSALALRGVPPRAIQELAGHSQITTTMRYMHLAPSALKDAIDTLETASAWQPRAK